MLPKDTYQSLSGIVDFVDEIGRNMQQIERFTTTKHLFPPDFIERNDGHTYRTSLLATAMHNKFKNLGVYINLGEVASIINLHDTPEVITFDIPLDVHRGEDNDNKHRAEMDALAVLTEHLHPDDADSFKELHKRFAQACEPSCRDTAALFARLCDAMEGNLTAFHRDLTKVDHSTIPIAVNERVIGVAQTLAQAIWKTDTLREDKIAAIHDLQIIVSHHMSLYADQGLYL